MPNHATSRAQLQPCEDRLLEYSFPQYVREKTALWKAEKRTTAELPQGLREIGDQRQFSLNDYLVRIGYTIAHGDSRERAVIVREMMKTHDSLEALRKLGKLKQGEQKDRR